LFRSIGINQVLLANRQFATRTVSIACVSPNEAINNAFEGLFHGKTLPVVDIREAVARPKGDFFVLHGGLYDPSDKHCGRSLEALGDHWLETSPTEAATRFQTCRKRENHRKTK
jgi:hypothetical protein